MACCSSRIVPAAIGTAQLQSAYEHTFATFGLDRTFHFDQILIDGSLASVRTHTTGTLTVRASGAVVPAEGREAFVLNRVAGNWKIAQYMFQRMPSK